MAAVDLAIRDAIVAALSTPTITVDGRDLVVKVTRYAALSESAVKNNHVAIVLADDEDADTDEKQAPFLMGVDLGIDVQIGTRKVGGAEDTLRAVALAIQHRIAGLNNGTAGGARSLKYRGRRMVDDEENLDIARVDLRFTAFYLALDSAMDVPL